jgi:LPS-assembly protein
MGGGRTSKLTSLAVALALGATLATSLGGPAQAAQDTLLPPGFFEHTPTIGNDNIAITADTLTYDADNHRVIAVGDVQIDYRGDRINGDRLVFDQVTHTAHFVGDVVVHSADGQIYTGTDLQLTNAQQSALMQQLTLTTKDGALITAADGDFHRGDDTVLNHATYSPCGECIDSKGRRIGWSAKSVQMIYHKKTETIELKQPSLYLLGVPVAWLPWLSLPNPSKRISTFRMPSVDSSDQFGYRVNAPYFWAVDDEDDVILTPSLMSRQGLLMAGEWDHRFPNGRTVVRLSGIYQLDPGAYAGTVGDIRWRGSAQTAGQFVPLKDWTVGWSYTAFTDAAYLIDYHFTDATNTGRVNQAYATHLAGNEFLDFRVQQFNLLGNVTQAQQDRQAKALPNVHYSNVLYLPQQLGEVDLTGTLLGVQRGSDHNLGKIGTEGVQYYGGYAEWKMHGMAEADWQKRFIAPGGIAVTPFLGLRTDVTYYDGKTTLLPGTQTLFTPTPIAAVDVRYPWIARSDGVSQIFEPIAQLYYRGSDTTAVGVSNDDAQSFIFDDSNLFSYNRFSGSDRQETGLRANLGGHYQVNFANGSWFDVLGGQSFQLAGANAFTATDPAQATTGQGLSSDASYLVLGAKGSPFDGLQLGTKFQIDPSATQITRSAVGGTYSIAGYHFALDYLYNAANPARGVDRQQQEVAAGVSVPLWDYWRVSTHGSWDIAANHWLDVGGGIHYDDSYLRYGADIEMTGPTNTNANDVRFTGSFFLSGLGGSGFSH